MLAEFLESLVDLAHKSAEPQLLDIPNSGDKLIFHGGVKELITVGPEPRWHKLETIESFIGAVVNYHNEHRTGSSIWINQRHVAYVFDDLTKRDILTLELRKSEHYEAILKLEKPQRLGQRDMVELLRHTFHGCVSDSLLPRVRKIETATNGRAASDVQHGKEKGTREFQAELIGAAEIPEYIEIYIDLFENVPLPQKQSVECSLAVTLPPQPVEFTVQPLPDALKKAMLHALRQLQHLVIERLKVVTDAEIPVFIGSLS